MLLKPWKLRLIMFDTHQWCRAINYSNYNSFVQIYKLLSLFVKVFLRSLLWNVRLMKVKIMYKLSINSPKYQCMKLNIDNSSPSPEKTAVADGSYRRKRTTLERKNKYRKHAGLNYRPSYVTNMWLI